MKDQEESNIVSLLSKATEEQLYAQLVLQLNKDLKFANINLEFEEDISPDKLKRDLHETIFHLINDKFSDYLNLLYIVDVSESQVRKLDGSDVVVLSGQVVYLILKREWQKVWYKYRY